MKGYDQSADGIWRTACLSQFVLLDPLAYIPNVEQLVAQMCADGKWRSLKPAAVVKMVADTSIADYADDRFGNFDLSPLRHELLRASVAKLAPDAP